MLNTTWMHTGKDSMSINMKTNVFQVGLYLLHSSLHVNTELKTGQSQDISCDFCCNLNTLFVIN